MTAERNGWKFSIPTDDVRQAIEKRIAHHKERSTWWTTEREAIEQVLKARGFQFETRAYTGGADVVAKLDPELARRLGECNSKLLEHGKLLDLYQMWLRLLRHAVDRLELGAEDFDFFGL